MPHRNKDAEAVWNALASGHNTINSIVEKTKIDRPIVVAELVEFQRTRAVTKKACANVSIWEIATADKSSPLSSAEKQDKIFAAIQSGVHLPRYIAIAAGLNETETVIELAAMTETGRISQSYKRYDGVSLTAWFLKGEAPHGRILSDGTGGIRVIKDKTDEEKSVKIPEKAERIPVTRIRESKRAPNAIAVADEKVSLTELITADPQIVSKVQDILEKPLIVLPEINHENLREWASWGMSVKETAEKIGLNFFDLKTAIKNPSNQKIWDEARHAMQAKKFPLPNNSPSPATLEKNQKEEKEKITKMSGNNKKYTTDQMKALGLEGLTVKQAAAKLAIAENSLYWQFNQHPELKTAYREGIDEFKTSSSAGEQKHLKYDKAAKGIAYNEKMIEDLAYNFGNYSAAAASIGLKGPSITYQLTKPEYRKAWDEGIKRREVFMPVPEQTEILSEEPPAEATMPTTAIFRSLPGFAPDGSVRETEIKKPSSETSIEPTVEEISSDEVGEVRLPENINEINVPEVEEIPLVKNYSPDTPVIDLNRTALEQEKVLEALKEMGKNGDDLIARAVSNYTEMIPVVKYNRPQQSQDFEIVGAINEPKFLELSNQLREPRGVRNIPLPEDFQPRRSPSKLVDLGKAGTIEISLAVDLWELDPETRNFVTKLIDDVREFQNKKAA